MPELNISELTNTLRKKKARWEAAENPISKMAAKDRKKLLGFDVRTALKTEPTAAAAAVAGFDAAVDWRNRHGNHVTSVKDQGHCGSCVSFCTVAVTESMASIEKGKVLDLSEADQHFCSSHGASCSGWNHTDAFNQIMSRGVSDEACFPYLSAFPGNDTTKPPSCKACADRLSRAVKITALHNLNSDTEAKNYLTTTGPIAAAFAVYTDFFGYHTGVYHHVSGDLEGHHCVAIIGYSEAEQCWICKNSWGPGWGAGGFFKLAYGEVEINNFAKTGVTGVVLPSLRDGTYLIRAIKRDGTVSARYLDLDTSTNGELVRLNAIYNNSTAGTGQRWAVAKIPDAWLGGSTIRNQHFGTYLDADYPNTDNAGCKVQGWERGLGGFRTNQEWKIKIIDDSNAAKIRCRVFNMKSPAMVLDGKDNASEDSGLYLFHNNPSNHSQEFIFEKVN